MITTSFLFRLEDAESNVAKLCQSIEAELCLFLGNIKAGTLRDDALALGDELGGVSWHRVELLFLPSTVNFHAKTKDALFKASFFQKYLNFQPEFSAKELRR